MRTESLNAGGHEASPLLPSLRERQCAPTRTSPCSDLLECRPREGPELRSPLVSIAKKASTNPSFVNCSNLAGNHFGSADPELTAQQDTSTFPWCQVGCQCSFKGSTSRYKWTHPARWYPLVHFGHDAFDRRWTHPALRASIQQSAVLGTDSPCRTLQTPQERAHGNFSPYLLLLFSFPCLRETRTRETVS